MQEDRLPKLAVNYKPTGYRSVGHPRMRWFPEQALQPNLWSGDDYDDF